MFPEGVFYDQEIEGYRTPKHNTFLHLINTEIASYKNKKKRQKEEIFNLSLSVRMKGLEPPRLSAPDPKSGAATNYATSAATIALAGTKIYYKFQKTRNY